jgi:hypothetical protein
MATRPYTVADGIGELLPGAGGNERAMVIEQGYPWTHVPGTDLEVRVLATAQLHSGTGQTCR